ncbi:TonB-dependent receptor plug domain-containing protein [Calditrichota bacterium]
MILLIEQKQFCWFGRLIVLGLVCFFFASFRESRSEIFPPSLSGIIEDSKTGLPLGEAHIRIEETGQLSLSDEDGIFRLNKIQAGNYTLTISFLGYKKKNLRVEIREGQPSFHYVELESVMLESPELNFIRSRSNPFETTVIDERTINNSSWKDVGEAVRTLPGVQVYEDGGLGGKKTASLRGCRPDHVMVMVDDAVLNDGSGSAVDLGMISIQNISRIEISRGLELDGGFGGLGGLIRIYTRAFDHNSSISGSLNSGIQSYSGRQIGGQIEDHPAGISARVTAQYLSSEGNFEYPNESGETDSRINNQVQQISSSLDVSKNILSTWNIRSGLAFAVSERGSPSPLFQAATPESEQRESVFRFNLTASRLLENGALKIRSGAQTKARHYVNPRYQFDSRTGQTSAHPPVNLKDRDNKFGISTMVEDVGYSWKNTNISSDVGIGIDVESYDAANALENGLSDPIHEEIIRTGAWTYGQFEIKYNFNEYELSLSESGRIDGLNDTPAEISSPFSGEYFPVYSSGSRLALTSGESTDPVKWRLYLGMGNSFSPPSFVSTFLVESIYSRGNPNLKPERATEKSLGGGIIFAPALARFSFSANAWNRQTKDLIVWTRNSRGQYFPDNLARASVKGIEISSHSSFVNDRITLEGSYTIQRALNDDPVSPYYGRRIPFQPDWYGSARCVANLKIISTGLENRFSDRRYFSESNLDPYGSAAGNLAPFYIWNGWLSRNFSFNRWNLKLNAGVENMFDSKYELIAKMPMPGRIWKIGLEISR